MKRIMCITLFSSSAALFCLLISFIMGEVFYNVENGVLFYQIDLLPFFKNFNVKDVGFFCLIFSTIFVITYLRYKDYFND
ncbi:hypothetical protein BKL50_05330 [Rodentibacter pneumotropicus]|nr:hypothetical protein BKL50_05330 [Rodentibacter pneumotropicus]